jgi:hypothetical protein
MYMSNTCRYLSMILTLLSKWVYSTNEDHNMTWVGQEDCPFLLPTLFPLSLRWVLRIIFLLICFSLVRWHTHLTPALERLRKESLEFNASLCCIIIPCLKEWNTSKKSASRKKTTNPKFIKVSHTNCEYLIESFQETFSPFHINLS